MKRLLFCLLAACSLTSAAQVDYSEHQSSEKSVTLDEVTVKGARTIQKVDGQWIYPTKQQIENSANGYSLLAKLTLPHIRVDEAMTLYFHKIDRLIGTARSNKVAVILGFQELPQLEADYGKVGMQKIITTIGNVVSGSARNKETLEWLSNDIFGKTVQLKKGVTIDRDRTSINLNENMDSMVPASKISDMPSGWICGQVARDFTPTKTGRHGSMNIQKSEEFQTSKFYCKRVFREFLVPCKSTTYASRLLKRHKRETKCTEIVPLLFLGYKGTNFPRNNQKFVGEYNLIAKN